jgi:DNA repair exonuclease SbcCD ATPase subunit
MKEEFEKKKKENILMLERRIEYLSDKVKESLTIANKLEDISTSSMKIMALYREKDQEAISFISSIPDLVGPNLRGFMGLDLVKNAYDQVSEVNSKLSKEKWELDSKYKAWLQALSELERKLKKVGTQEIGQDSCSYCGYTLTEETKNHSLSHLKAEIVALGAGGVKKEKIEESAKKIKETGSALATLKDFITEIEGIDRKVAFYEKEKSKLRQEAIALEAAKGQDIQLRLQIEELKKSEYVDTSKKVKEQLADLEDELQELKITESALKTKIAICSWAIKDPLSNSGIKAYLFSSLLERLNWKLEYYSNLSGFLVKLLVDEDSGRKNIEAIIFKEGYPVDVKDLSGGETQLVNVLIALASGEVLLTDVDVNIRVFDEVSEHLDYENIELLGTFLKNLSEQYNVFVITHNKHFIVSGANEINI